MAAKAFPTMAKHKKELLYGILKSTVEKDNEDKVLLCKASLWQTRFYLKPSTRA